MLILELSYSLAKGSLGHGREKFGDDKSEGQFRGSGRLFSLIFESRKHNIGLVKILD